MRIKWFFLISLLLIGKHVMGNEIIPAPKIVITERFITDWKAEQTIFAVDYSPILERYPIGARAARLVRELPININSESPLPIRLRLRGQNVNDDRAMQDLVPDSVWNKKEGYVLSIGKDQISVYGFDQAGLLYAVQSLRQLMSSFSQGHPLRIQTIIDYPTFEFRGVMDDISRGPLNNMAFLKEQIERFSLMKLNVVSYYIEHILRTKNHFAYAPLDGLTIQELHDLSEFADSFNIRIMGGFQSLGHFKNILQHPNYSALGASERMLTPADANSLQFLFDNYSEIIPATSHPYFNINCDEAYDLDRGPALKDLADQIGKGGVYFNHIYPLLQHVQKEGKIPAIWGDVLLQHPEIIEKLPEGTVVFTWNYAAQENFDDFILPFSSRNIDFVVTPGVVNSYKIWPDLREAEKNITHFSQEGWKHGAKGVLTTVWDDGGRHFFACDWYGVAIGAEHSWNPEHRESIGFADKFYKIFYRGNSSLFSRFLDKLNGFQNTTRLRDLDHSLTEMNLDIKESKGFIDTSEFTDLLHQSEVTQQNIYQIAQEISGEALFPVTDFHFWLFKIRELKESILSARAICDINQLKTNVKLSDSHIGEEITTIATNRLKSSQELAEQFEILWYKENRDYSFRTLNRIYEGKIDFWKDVQSLATSGNTGAIPIYQGTSDKYFTYWLAAGPFSMVGKQNINTDFFKPLGGEKMIRPSAVDYYPDQMGKYHSWQKIISDRPEYVDLDEYFPDPAMKMLYFNCQLYSDNDLTVSFESRFKGQLKIILNGRVLDNQVSNEPGISDGELYLNKGRNDLVIKIQTIPGGENKFLFFIPGYDVHSAKYRYYLSEQEQ